MKRITTLILALILALAFILPTGSSSRVAAQGIQWELEIYVEGEGVSDLISSAGVAYDAKEGYDTYDAPEPPFANPPSIGLYFPHPDWPSPYQGDYNRDVKPPADEITWLFEVKTSFDGEVTMTWDTSQVPTSYAELLLQDKASGATIDLLTETQYIYTSESNQPRAFDLIARGMMPPPEEELEEEAKPPEEKPAPPEEEAKPPEEKPAPPEEEVTGPVVTEEEAKPPKEEPTSSETAPTPVEEPQPTNWAYIGGIIAAVVVIGGVVYLLVGRRRST